MGLYSIIVDTTGEWELIITDPTGIDKVLNAHCIYDLIIGVDGLINDYVETYCYGGNQTSHIRVVDPVRVSYQLDVVDGNSTQTYISADQNNPRYSKEYIVPHNNKNQNKMILNIQPITLSPNEFIYDFIINTRSDTFQIRDQQGIIIQTLNPQKNYDLYLSDTGINSQETGDAGATLTTQFFVQNANKYGYTMNWSDRGIHDTWVTGNDPPLRTGPFNVPWDNNDTNYMTMFLNRAVACGDVCEGPCNGNCPTGQRCHNNAGVYSCIVDNGCGDCTGSCNGRCPNGQICQGINGVYSCITGGPCGDCTGTCNGNCPSGYQCAIRVDGMYGCILKSCVACGTCNGPCGSEGETCVEDEDGLFGCVKKGTPWYGSWWFITIMVLLSIIIVAAIGWFLLKSKKPPAPLNTTIKPVTTVKPASVPGTVVKPVSTITNPTLPSTVIVPSITTINPVITPVTKI